MKFPTTNEFPEIKWEQYKLMDYDTDERSQTWEMEGLDSAGNKYSGIGEYSCGELITISQIELKLITRMI